MTVHTVQRDDEHGHKSFRLTRPGGDVRTDVHPDVVLTGADARALLAAAGRRDVAVGGTFSPGPAGVQLWSGPWNGAGGRVGTAEHFGSVDWSWDTPVLESVTVYRILLTAAGVRSGLTTHTLLDRVLALTGLAATSSTPSAPAAARLPLPRDPFRNESWSPRVLTDSTVAAEG